MISAELEIVLHRCFVSAREARHKFVTVDHLILEMLGERTVADHLTASSVDVDKLRTDLQTRISVTDAVGGSNEEFDTQPTLEFQRALQRAILQVHSSGEREVTPLHLLSTVLEQEGNLATATLSDQAAGLDVVKKIRASAQVCALCGKSSSRASLTKIQDRGVLCSECIAAVLKAAGKGKR